MARSPRPKVSKTSGQGVSRRAYQTAYSLGNRGTGSEFKAGLKQSADSRRYAKLDVGTDFNVSYGDTMEPGDLADVKAIAKRKLPRRGK